MASKPARATISDVARIAKTGKTSVSRYLNGEQRLLSDDLKNRISQAISELNYSPSQMARSLKHGKTRLIGLIIADITNPYSIEVMGGIEAACRDKGFTLLMCNTNNEVHREEYYLQLLCSYQVEGIIVNAVGMQESAFASLQHSQTPLTLIDRKVSNYACDVVGLDNHQSSRLLTNHLIENDYQALLFISGPLAPVNTRLERLQAFKEIVAEHTGVSAENYEYMQNSPEELNQAIAEFLHRHADKRCAIIAANGSLTLQVSKQLKQLGKYWGTDIGLAGFDEMGWSSLAGCGITTLKQPTYQIGYAALESILARIKKQEKPLQEIRFDGELVIRPSSGRLTRA